MRPRQLGDLTLPRKDIERLQWMIDNDAILNLLFYGQWGIGKTSAARVFKGNDKYGSIEKSGPNLRKRDDIDKHITGFAMSMSLLSDKRKLCFIDDAERMPKAVQAVLSKVVEDTSANCRFIMTANDKTKLIPALGTRLIEICFDVAPADRAEVIERLRARYAKALHEMDVAFDDQRLAEIVGIWFPDMRAIANHIEYEFLQCAVQVEERKAQ